jgi:phage gpG-like protein
MSFTVEIDDSRVQARLKAMPAKLLNALSRKTTVLRLQLEAKVKGKLSGDVLNVRSGALRRSIFSDQSETPTSVEGRVASSADVKYGRIHEFGGKTAAHDILPKKAQALAFAMGGKTVFAKVVHHPGSHIPERSFMRSSLKEMREQIVDGYKAAALKEAEL